MNHSFWKHPRASRPLDLNNRGWAHDGALHRNDVPPSTTPVTADFGGTDTACEARAHSLRWRLPTGIDEATMFRMYGVPYGEVMP